MAPDDRLRRALDGAALPPAAHEAEERAWHVARAAYGAREPLRPRTPRARVLAMTAAVVTVAGAAASQPGRALVGEVREAIGIREARTALFRLPASGPGVLVESEPGAWLVHADGSKRLLGPWREASWSPFGVYVVATARDEVAALEPDGDVRWKLSRPAVSHARWGGTRVDTRVAYLSGRDLRVVAGDGSGDRLLARSVRALPPAWRPGGRHAVTYVAGDGRLVTADADAGRTLWSRRVGPVRGLAWSRDGARLLVHGPRSLRVLGRGGEIRLRLLEPAAAAPVVTAALSPSGRSLAFVQRARRRSVVWLIPRLRPDGSAARRIFSGAGSLQDLAWSPDGRWLLVAWREADQWLFIRAGRVGKIEAVSGITGQFDSTRFPRVAGWCC